MASTSRTRRSTRTIPATPRAITIGTAITNSTRWSTLSRWRRTRKSARNWFGRSRSSPRTSRVRCSTTAFPGPAGTYTSRATRCSSMPSTTGCGWKTYGSTSSALRKHSKEGAIAGAFVAPIKGGGPEYGSRSVRHQHRYSHMIQQSMADPTDQRFAKPRVMVGTGDYQIGVEIGGARQQQLGDRHIACDYLFEPGWDAVPSEMP